MATKQQKFGIQTIQAFAQFAFTTAGHVTNGLKDGKIDFSEQLQLLTDVLQGISLVKAIPLLKSELKELSAAEKTQLREFIKSQFAEITIGNKELDALIKKTINWASDGIEISTEWKQFKK